ncbi:acyl-CoA thioesterase [Flavobacterium silvaticum]|uniref:Acyl-CoA thioesterase n=1 Tax=Flavobacterium silvaticum TaxID=1852020 RepID=A0A972FNK1_9FLAO|nr:acyl-CoA thioesterase [Flavobacterium silvaticum]NMH28998.1 acyl-CoA thioesterase [Flavobacterium silvaticum]
MKKFTKTETVRFKHVDFAGIVFYPRFLEMLNDLVEDWFGEALERPFSKIHTTNGIPTVDLKVQFKKPARIGDELEKSLWVTNLGGASVTCGFAFTHADGSICLEGEVTLVNVGLDKGPNQIKAVPFTDETRNLISAFITNNNHNK